MKISKLVVLRTIFVIGFVVSLYMTCMELIVGSYCPKISTIPACYLILISFILLLVSQFDWENRNIKIASFYFGAFGGVILSLWFSYNHFLKLKQCPLIMNKFPACYVFLIVFVVVLSYGREI